MNVNMLGKEKYSYVYWMTESSTKTNVIRKSIKDPAEKGLSTQKSTNDKPVSPAHWCVMPGLLLGLRAAGSRAVNCPIHWPPCATSLLRKDKGSNIANYPLSWAVIWPSLRSGPQEGKKQQDPPVRAEPQWNSELNPERAGTAAGYAPGDRGRKQSSLLTTCR